MKVEFLFNAKVAKIALAEDTLELPYPQAIFLSKFPTPSWPLCDYVLAGVAWIIVVLGGRSLL